MGERETVGVGAGTWGLGFGGDCRGDDDRDRDFFEAGGDGAGGAVCFGSVRGLDCGGDTFVVWGALVRGVGCGDSRGGRGVRLFAAGIWAWLGIFVWVDAFDCGAAFVFVVDCGWVGAVSGISFAGDWHADFYLAHCDSWIDWLAEAL